MMSRFRLSESCELGKIISHIGVEDGSFKLSDSEGCVALVGETAHSWNFVVNENSRARNDFAIVTLDAVWYIYLSVPAGNNKTNLTHRPFPMPAPDHHHSLPPQLLFKLPTPILNPSQGQSAYPSPLMLSSNS